MTEEEKRYVAFGELVAAAYNAFIGNDARIQDLIHDLNGTRIEADMWRKAYGQLADDYNVLSEKAEKAGVLK
jgi:hypothetical protein